MDSQVAIDRSTGFRIRPRTWTVFTILALVVWPIIASVIVGTASVGAQPPETQKSVLDGIYTEAQAARGQEAYRQECAGCHLDSLGGADMAPGLVGEAFQKQWTDLTVGDLFERIRISMPQDSPAHLSRQAYVDIVAYILNANNFPAGSSELTHDLATLKQIKIVAKTVGPARAAH
jgi:mono/diheme cytochrome c family protein